jgi:hypothetical protein
MGTGRPRVQSKTSRVHGRSKQLRVALVAIAGMMTMLSPFIATLRGQGGDLQQKIADLKESTAKNKQAIAQYTWTENVTISLKGQEKKQERFKVRMGPDGKPIKTSMDPVDSQADAPRGGRLRQRIVEKKKEEYKDYAERMKQVAQQYLPPEKDLIQDAYSKGNISITPGAGGPGKIKFVIRNYVRQGDEVTLFFDKDQKQMDSLSIHSWIDDASDAMNLTVRFDRLPDGTSHAAGATMEGVSKQLTIVTRNYDYRKL